MEEELYNKISKFLKDVDNQIPIYTEMLSGVGNCMLNLQYNWRRYVETKEVDEADAIAQCMLQMMICKVRSVTNLSEGIVINPDTPSLRILDIPTIASVVRNMYEMAFVFHNIFVEQSSKEERDVVLYLWEIIGLNNRQGLHLVPDEYKNREADEKRQIDGLRSKIIAIFDKINVSDKVKKDVLHVIDTKRTNIKGYSFEKDETGRIVSFKDVRFDAGYGNLQNHIHPDTYRYLSFLTHPSYISVLQFGQMFNKNEDKVQLRMLLVLARQLASRMCLDFVHSVTDAQKVYNALDDEGKMIIETWS
jgi:hypothetical protein